MCQYGMAHNTDVQLHLLTSCMDYHASIVMQHRHCFKLCNKLTRYICPSRCTDRSHRQVTSQLLFAGFELDEVAFATLFKSFNPDCTSYLSIAEYIAMTLFLQSASATFEAFDRQKKGAITLDFNQWIYATANVV